MRSHVFADDRFRFEISALGPSSLLRARRARFARLAQAVPREARRAKRGGARRNRTDDLMLAKHALSQLSYGPVTGNEARSACLAEARVDKPSPVGFRRGSLTLATASEGWWAWE